MVAAVVLLPMNDDPIDAQVGSPMDAWQVQHSGPEELQALADGGGGHHPTPSAR